MREGRKEDAVRIMRWLRQWQWRGARAEVAVVGYFVAWYVMYITKKCTKYKTFSSY